MTNGGDCCRRQLLGHLIRKLSDCSVTRSPAGERRAAVVSIRPATCPVFEMAISLSLSDVIFGILFARAVPSSAAADAAATFIIFYAAVIILCLSPRRSFRGTDGRAGRTHGRTVAASGRRGRVAEQPRPDRVVGGGPDAVYLTRRRTVN